MSNSSNFHLSPGSLKQQTNAPCSGLVAQNVLLGIACFLGIIATSILFVFSFKYRRGDLTPDKLLITNFAAADLIACLISTGLPSSVCVVGCAFVMAVSVYQISKTKTEI